MGNTYCVLFGCVEQSSVGVVERWGRFEKLAQPGLHFFNPFAGECLAGILSTRISSLDVRIETKTKDNVFVQLLCSIQYRVIKENADDAFYELQNPQEQIQAYVFDVVRAVVPKMNLDELFEQKGEVAKAVSEELEKVMGDYGYSLEHILMVDIIPDASVRRAMNEINAGIEVKPGKPYAYHSDNVTGKLRITQATLGPGSSKERSIVQCSVGNKSPIFLCSLIPNKIESCPLDLEFEEDESIAFSVSGPQSIHLSGYFVANEQHVIRDDYESDSFGEDIAETDTEDSSEYDTGDEYDDEFIDDDDDYPGMYSTSPVPKSGVVIEEIVDDEKSNDANGQAKKVKKNKSSDSEDIRNSQRQIVLKRNVEKTVSESEDEDGFPIPTKSKSKANIQKLESEQEQKGRSTEDVKETKAKDGSDASSLKRKVENDEQVDLMERKKKKKQKKKVKDEKAQVTHNDGDMGSEKQQAEDENAAVNPISDGDEKDKKISKQRDASTHTKVVDGENHKEDKQKKKTKKKGKKNMEAESGSKSDELTKTAGDQIESALGSKEKENESKSSRVRTFANGLVIEDVAMGKPDGKRASPGNTVSVHYIGKLKNGKIFDSNIGRAPFKFRLGVGQVIKGWDVGVNGMRIGDKRRLTIPPSMGYGDAKIGKIPQNSWLTFDVELVGVR